MVLTVSSQLTLIRREAAGLLRPVSQRLGFSLLFLCSLLLMAVAVPAVAATFPVNSRDDVVDLEAGNGLCVAYLRPISLPSFFFLLPFCTLRAAIEETNALPGEDTIILGSGTYRLSLDGVGEDQAATGDLDITDSVHIAGAGAAKTFIDAEGLDRVFDILGSGITVTLTGVTIRNGSLPAGRVADQQGGGGIRNQGVLSLTAVVVSDNQVTGATVDDAGGGLLNQGECLLANSTISGNRAVQGGGIMNDIGGSLQITASTINDNTGESGAGFMNMGAAEMVNSTLSCNRAQGGVASGGGVYNREQLRLTHCTIAENSAAQGSGLVNDGGSVFLVNTLLANNPGGNCFLSNSLLSEGYNLDSDDTCGLTALDLKNIDPLLGLFQDNGGDTKTYGLSPDSPAVDAGTTLPDVFIDQRGLARPQRKGVDIGALEINALSVTPMIMPLLL